MSQKLGQWLCHGSGSAEPGNWASDVLAPVVYHTSRSGLGLAVGNSAAGDTPEAALLVGVYFLGVRLPEHGSTQQTFPVSFHCIGFFHVVPFLHHMEG